jgi:hypothetical protein
VLSFGGVSNGRKRAASSCVSSHEIYWPDTSSVCAGPVSNSAVIRSRMRAYQASLLTELRSSALSRASAKSNTPARDDEIGIRQVENQLVVGYAVSGPRPVDIVAQKMLNRCGIGLLSSEVGYDFFNREIWLFTASSIFWL